MAKIISFLEAAHMFNDIWNLYKKYAVRKLSDEEIDDFTKEASQIHARYKYPFVKEVVLAVIGEVERSVKHFEEGNRC